MRISSCCFILAIDLQCNVKCQIMRFPTQCRTIVQYIIVLCWRRSSWRTNLAVSEKNAILSCVWRFLVVCKGNRKSKNLGKTQDLEKHDKKRQFKYAGSRVRTLNIYVQWKLEFHSFWDTPSKNLTFTCSTGHRKSNKKQTNKKLSLINCGDSRNIIFLWTLIEQRNYLGFEFKWSLSLTSVRALHLKLQKCKYRNHECSSNEILGDFRTWLKYFVLYRMRLNEI